MMKIEDEVEFGLDAVDPNRSIEIPLRDALYAYKVIGEFISFFHQPLHWESLEQVRQFIGNVEEGALHVAREAYYRRLRNAWPNDIKVAFGEGTFDRNPFTDN